MTCIVGHGNQLEDIACSSTRKQEEEWRRKMRRNTSRCKRGGSEGEEEVQGQE